MDTDPPDAQLSDRPSGEIVPRTTDNRGWIVGRFDTPDGVAHGYVLKNRVFSAIDHPDAAGFTVATVINPSGQVAGRYLGLDHVFHGFVLDHGVFTTVDHLGANGQPDMGPQGIQGMAIDPEGELIAGYYQDTLKQFHAFVLQDGGYTTIDPPNAKNTGGAGGVLHVNASDTVVGSFTKVGDVPLPCGCADHEFLYRDGAFNTFDLPGAQVTVGAGINSRGDIVGVYVDQQNRSHGFLVARRGEEE